MFPGSHQKANYTHREQAGEERSVGDIQVHSDVHGRQAADARQDAVDAV